MSFNTLEGGLVCPHCKAEIISGVGFRLGTIASLRYKIGDSLSWEGENCRPATRPQTKEIKTLGYYNCDNIKCSSWQDCYPDVQVAVVTVANDKIASVEPYQGPEPAKEFQILEPAELAAL
ncbi:MAG: hypothetical protein SGJ27_26840 [Candidatus Melainabacteria bacterium]|nr:hypothetical protein [Candidatus Melainabacteria bacterium]